MKDRLFFYAVEKNWNILSEYQEYKWSHEDGAEKKIKSWIYLLILNIKYRLLRIGDNSHVKNAGSVTKSIKKPRPFLNGAESELNKREAVQHFTNRLLNFDIVSFDILDTLVLRPFANPADMFYLLEIKHKYLNFANIRKDAEREARKIKFEESGTYEINIYDIYKLVSKITGLDQDFCIKLEFSMELELCFPNPYIKDVYEILKNNNKKMIAVSDMYFPKKYMEIILENCGYIDFEEIFMSCDYDASKRHMDLYKVVDEKLQSNGSKKIVHIGDNYVSDVVKAKEFGWEAIYYRNVNVIGRDFRTVHMTRMISSAYRGVVNAHLHNGIKKYSPTYEFGFIYGGLMAVGFCSYIHRYCLENNIDKILFLSRDGDILQDVYNLLYKDNNAIANEYVFWSRNPGKILTSNISRFDYFRQYIDYKCGNKQDFMLSDILESMNIGFLIPKLVAVDLNKEDIITVENKDILKEFILENWEIVQMHYDKNRKAAKMYFDPILSGFKKAVAVDIGWQGTGVIDFKKTIENVLEYPCEVSGLMMSYANRDIDYTTSFFMNKDINVYLWSSQHNRELFYKHGGRPQNNIFMELFTTATHPSFKNFELINSGYELKFDVPEVENYQAINDVQQGMKDFAKNYYKFFKNHDLMFNISGYDAYAPFTHITEDLSFIKKHFGKYVFNRFIGGVKGNDFYNVDDIMQEFKLSK